MCHAQEALFIVQTGNDSNDGMGTLWSSSADYYITQNTCIAMLKIPSTSWRNSSHIIITLSSSCLLEPASEKRTKKSCSRLSTSAYQKLVTNELDQDASSSTKETHAGLPLAGQFQLFAARKGGEYFVYH